MGPTSFEELIEIISNKEERHIKGIHLTLSYLPSKKKVVEEFLKGIFSRED